MTVEDLIKQLQKIEDKDRLIKVWDNHISGTRNIVHVTGREEHSHEPVWISI